MTIEIEKIHNSRRFHRVKEKCSAHVQKIQNGVQLQGVPVPPIYESCYSVMDEDLSLSLHILDQSEREQCGNEVFVVLLHGVSSS